VGEQADLALVAVVQERVRAAVDCVLRDCVALGAPVPEFVVRVGREPVERFDGRYVHLTEALLAQLDPAGVHVHVSVPPDRSSVTVRAALGRSVEDLCAEFAEVVQQLLIEGELRGAAWPPCPVHAGRHPLWPEQSGRGAVWACTNPPGFSAAIGHLDSRLACPGS
jgi:hypothetical protein